MNIRDHSPMLKSDKSDSGNSCTDEESDSSENG